MSKFFHAQIDPPAFRVGRFMVLWMHRSSLGCYRLVSSHGHECTYCLDLGRISLGWHARP